ncbi:hypothetical protein [Propionispora vibrioides]|uniref:Uncharacterized protein n=1 Tax=Propionispora vibrioides TaxID=112903 RepID=A0A1H8XMD0_9FIRM|nr:hypothetical protein [Propionispora vibrioides]SEP41110.1 hypothetical protein SAMN04490178_12624 [Propionispora vibrioides]
MDISYIFMIFAVMVGVAYILLVPKEQYKRYLLYGLTFGSIVDVILVSILTYMGLLKYQNMGAFNVLGIISAWTPVSWGLTFSIFFYLMPKRKSFLLAYVPAFAALSQIIGMVFRNYGLIEYRGRFLLFFVFLVWYAFAAWAYRRDLQFYLLRSAMQKKLHHEDSDDDM